MLHLKAKHRAYLNSDLNYFKFLKEKFARRSTIEWLFTTHTVSVSRTLEVSYEFFYSLINVEKSYYRRGFN